MDNTQPHTHTHTLTHKISRSGLNKYSYYLSLGGGGE